MLDGTKIPSVECSSPIARTTTCSSSRGSGNFSPVQPRGQRVLDEGARGRTRRGRVWRGAVGRTAAPARSRCRRVTYAHGASSPAASRRRAASPAVLAAVPERQARDADGATTNADARARRPLGSTSLRSPRLRAPRPPSVFLCVSSPGAAHPSTEPPPLAALFRPPCRRAAGAPHSRRA